MKRIGRTREVAPSTEYAVRPADFGGITPKVLVKVGDAVLVGTPLFVDKATEQVKVVFARQRNDYRCGAR